MKHNPTSADKAAIAAAIERDAAHPVRPPWTLDAPCDNCGVAKRHHDEYDCGAYLPVTCKGPDDLHGGPVRVRPDDAELCTNHDLAREDAP